MDQGGDGRDGKLPFETKPDIDQDPEQSHDHGDCSAGDQLAGNRRTDDFDTAILDLPAERPFHLGDRGLLLLLRRLRGDANENGIGCAEFLNLNLADAEAAHFAANVGEIGGTFLGLDLDQRPALEIDTHVQADRRDENERNNGQECRDEPRDRPQADEIDLGIGRNEMDAAKHLAIPQSGMYWGRAQRSQ